MSDKKYPYIGECENGTVLFTSKSCGIALVKNNNAWSVVSSAYDSNWCEGDFKNITREYLTNTYGKCESQEHADFICKLAESHGFVVESKYEKERDFFNFYQDTLDFWIDEGTAKTENEKLIHLPLPPKEKEMEETKPTYTKEMHERGELPPVGSYFVMNDIPNHVSYKKFEGLTCKVLALTEHEDGVVVTFNNEKEGFGALWHHEGMEPIPTIEDELSIEIANYITQPKAIDCSELADLLSKKFNIAPKGE